MMMIMGESRGEGEGDIGVPAGGRPAIAWGCYCAGPLLRSNYLSFNQSLKTV